MAYTTPTTHVAGETLPAADWNVVVNNEIALQQSIVRLAYQTITSDFNVTTATVASATNIFSTGLTWTANGTSAYQIKFWAPSSYTSDILDRYLQFHLVDASGHDLGAIGQVGTCQATGRRAYGAVNLEVLYTPSAGSTTVNIRCVSVASGSGAIKAGPGGSGQLFPAYGAVYGPDLT